jgi:hypothetical protein
VPRAGFEPATTRSSASPSVTRSSWVERSPRLSYLGTFWTTLDAFSGRHRVNVGQVYLGFLRACCVEKRNEGCWRFFRSLTFRFTTITSTMRAASKSSMRALETRERHHLRRSLLTGSSHEESWSPQLRACRLKFIHQGHFPYSQAILTFLTCMAALHESKQSPKTRQNLNGE